MEDREDLKRQLELRDGKMPGRRNVEDWDCNESTGLCLEFYHCITDGLDSLKMRTRHAKEDTAAPGTQADQICVCRDSFKCV